MKNFARIAMFGPSLLSTHSNRRATYYGGMLKALHRHGFEITFYEPNTHQRTSYYDIPIPDPTCVKVVVYPPTFPGVLQCLHAARDADVVIKTSDIGIFDRELETVIAENASPTRATVFWDIDPPATLGRVLRDANDPFRALIPAYDLILTYGGGAPVVRAYKQLGASECVPIHGALDPTMHFPVTADPRFRGAIGFLGNRRLDREQRVEELFMAVARAQMDRRFVLAGAGWGLGPHIPDNVNRVGYVAAADHNVFNCSPLTVIHINRDTPTDFDAAPSTRVFEAAGIGACLLCDDAQGLESFLEPGCEVLTVRTGIDVLSHLWELDPDRAQNIGTAARRRILSEHTYAHRAAMLCRVLEGSDRAARPVSAAIAG